MSQNYIKVDKQGLEDTFCLVKTVEFSPIYEYVNGEKTSNIKGYKVPVLAVEGVYVGEDLELRVPFKLNLSWLRKIAFNVVMEETNVYSIKFGLQVLIWVFDIEWLN
mgnify:CR=1 FL=1